VRVTWAAAALASAVFVTVTVFFKVAVGQSAKEPIQLACDKEKVLYDEGAH